MTLREMKTIIDRVKEAFPTVGAVIFTGGECFLLRDC
jgi:MoaA/NifB/PqqE/SkfB family radical SAM enzyme